MAQLELGLISTPIPQLEQSFQQTSCHQSEQTSLGIFSKVESKSISIDLRGFSEKAGSHDDLIKVIKIFHNFSLMFGNECIVQALFGYFKRRSKSPADILWYKEIQQSKFDYH